MINILKHFDHSEEKMEYNLTSLVLMLPIYRLPGRHDHGHGHGGDGARAGRLQAQERGPGHQRDRGGGEVAAPEDTHRVPGLSSGSVYRLL